MGWLKKVVQLLLLLFCAAILIAAFSNRKMAHLPDAVPNVAVPAPEAPWAAVAPEATPAPAQP